MLFASGKQFNNSNGRREINVLHFNLFYNNNDITMQ